MIVVVLLEMLGNNAPSMPFHLETFFVALHLVLIMRAYTLVVLEGHLDMHVQDSRTLFEMVAGHKTCIRANVLRFFPSEYRPTTK